MHPASFPEHVAIHSYEKMTSENLGLYDEVEVDYPTSTPLSLSLYLYASESFVRRIEQ